MRIYVCYTPSHRALLDQHFSPSLPADLCDVVLTKFLQRSQSGAYESPGFQATCLDKVDFIIEALRAETEPFLFSDVDVRFYGPVCEDLLPLLGDADMAFQWDGPRGKECSGFMVLRPTIEVMQFWQNVRAHMRETGAMDQDALHAMLEASDLGLQTVVLPERYWTYGRGDKVWEPGTPVNPPADLLVHHGNWTVGVENKLALLEAVRAAYYQEVAFQEWDHVGGHPVDAVDNAFSGCPQEIDGNHVAVMPDGRLELGIVERESESEDRAPVIAAVQASEETAVKSHERLFTLDEVHQLIEDERNKLSVWTNSMPMAFVLQFWKGDKHEACELARLLADIEPQKVNDGSVFVFARQSNCELDEEIYETQLYVGNKFPYVDLVTDAPEWMKYPGVCGRAWVSAARQLVEAYFDGRMACHSAFFFEADGGPLPPLRLWRTRIKNAHQETLSFGKQFTGARMREKDHLNGTLSMALRAIVDVPSLQRCPASDAWDIFHGREIVSRSHPTNIVRNMYGVSLTEHDFHHEGREAAWVTSIKDGSHHHWARYLLDKQRRDCMRVDRLKALEVKQEHDELLAAYKKLAAILDDTEREWCRSEGQDYSGPSDELAEARALIAKLERKG